MQYAKDIAYRGEGMLEGMCELTRAFLEREALPRFPDTTRLSVDLQEFFNDSEVINELQRTEYWALDPRKAFDMVKSWWQVPKGESQDSSANVSSGSENWQGAEDERRKRWLTWVWGSLAVVLLAAGANRMNGGKGAGNLAWTATRQKHHEWTKAELGTQQAESLVREWQNTKARAMGRNHDVRALKTRLAGNLLNEWAAKALNAESLRVRWEYKLKHVKILNISRGTHEGTAVLKARIRESAALVDESTGEYRDAYDDTYVVTYWLRRGPNGSWRFFHSSLAA